MKRGESSFVAADAATDFSRAMTKTKLALLAGGAFAAALLALGTGFSNGRGALVARPMQADGIQSLVWDQPPGVPATGGVGRPKRLQQVVWDQPPGVPATGGVGRPKAAERATSVPV